MKLKKIILSCVLAMFIAAPVFAYDNAAATKTIVAKYKAGNYLGCIQSTEVALKNNPSNIYALYYQALAYSQIGKKDEAINAFDKVIALNSNEIIVRNAEKGKACLSSPVDCEKYSEKASAFDDFVNSGKFYSKEVQSEVNQRKLDKIRQDMNGSFTEKKTEAPSNEEIANAVKTLAKIGFNPMTGMNMMQSPEMMQMGMLLGDNNNGNNMNNMLPFLLMSQNQNGASNFSPELMQTMMMSQMQMY